MYWHLKCSRRRKYVFNAKRSNLEVHVNGLCQILQTIKYPLLQFHIVKHIYLVKPCNCDSVLFYYEFCS